MGAPAVLEIRDRAATVEALRTLRRLRQPRLRLHKVSSKLRREPKLDGCKFVLPKPLLPEGFFLPYKLSSIGILLEAIFELSPGSSSS
jgi:hypothetical protein